MWIFGYGMLMANPQFGFEEKLLGRVKNYQRRFYQQSVEQRGSKKHPGLVLTLVPAKGAEVWGVAYKIKKEQEAKLKRRLSAPDGEDGFVETTVTFYPKKEDSALQTPMETMEVKLKKFKEEQAKIRISAMDAANLQAKSKEMIFQQQHKEEGRHSKKISQINPAKLVQEARENRKQEEFKKKVEETPEPSEPKGDTISCLTYIAPSDNFLFSREEDNSNIALQIVKAKGSFGSNAAYVVAVAKAYRALYPKRDEDHIYPIEQQVLRLMKNASNSLISDSAHSGRSSDRIEK